MSAGQSVSTPIPKVPPGNDFRRRSSSELVGKAAISRIRDEDIWKDIRNLSCDPKSKENILNFARRLYELKLDQSNQDQDQIDFGRQSRKTKQDLEKLKPHFKKKYIVLQKRIREWKKVRVSLIKNMANFIKELDKNSKWCSTVRLLASTADVTGSVGGLLLQPESDWARYAFSAASVCGLCGVISTVLEVSTSKKILDKISGDKEDDYKLLESVIEWFQENQEMDSAVQDLFPYGIDKELSMQIQKESNELDDYSKVFLSVFLSSARKESSLVEDKDFLYSLQLFSRSDVASLWWNRIIFRKHPMDLDLSRMALQMECGQMWSLIYQSVPALPLEQQRLTSLPVAGRIMLNFLTMYDAFSSISNGAKSMYSEKLRKLLSVMKRELDVIDEAVERMKPADF